MSRKSLWIRSIHVSRLAELQKAGKGPRKSRRIVGVFILGIRAITTAKMGIGGRKYVSHVRKMVCVYGVDLLSKYKPSFMFS